MVHDGFDIDGFFFLYCSTYQVVVSFRVELVDPSVGLVFPFLLTCFDQILDGGQWDAACPRSLRSVLGDMDFLQNRSLYQLIAACTCDQAL